MKQFIILAAVLPILLIFMMQVAYDQKNSDAVHQVQMLVYAAKEDAKQAGCFTPEIKSNLKRGLSEALGILPEEVVIESDEQIKYRYSKGENRIIRYRVSVPMKDVMAGGSFFKMGEAENQYLYTIDSYTASERI